MFMAAAVSTASAGRPAIAKLCHTQCFYLWLHFWRCSYGLPMMAHDFGLGQEEWSVGCLTITAVTQ